MFQSPLAIDPYSMGIEERTFEELSSEEKMAVEQEMFSELGVDPDRLEELILREYITITSENATIPGEINVSVFETGKAGIFLQRLTYKDGEKRWVIGPDEDI